MAQQPGRGSAPAPGPVAARYSGWSGRRLACRAGGEAHSLACQRPVGQLQHLHGVAVAAAKPVLTAPLPRNEAAGPRNLDPVPEAGSRGGGRGRPRPGGFVGWVWRPRSTIRIGRASLPLLKRSRCSQRAGPGFTKAIAETVSEERLRQSEEESWKETRIPRLLPCISRGRRRSRWARGRCAQIEDLRPSKQILFEQESQKTRESVIKVQKYT